MHAKYSILKQPAHMSMHMGPFALHIHGGIWRECIERKSDWDLLSLKIEDALQRRNPYLAAELEPLAIKWCDEL